MRISEAVEDSAAEAAWRAASKHYLGGGLEEGEPSLEPARDARKWFSRKKMPLAIKALDIILCGGCWHRGRGQMERLCRCGQRDSAYDSYYTYPLLDETAKEDDTGIIASTEWMADDFSGELNHYACL